MISLYKSLKFTHLYIPVLLLIWVGLFLDSKMVSHLFEYNQWITNILVVTCYLYIYRIVSIKIKKLMLYGLIIAFMGESLFSLVFGMYTYRLQNLPVYIPFGHTLVYVCVFYISNEPIIKKNSATIQTTLISLIILYSIYWLILKNDVFGFICTLLVLLIFKVKPKTRLFFSFMFFVIVYLELLGTYYECWYWPEIWLNKVSFIPSANPPSGIGVFYFGFDVACLLFYKTLNKKRWTKLRATQQLRNNKQKEERYANQTVT